MVHKKYIKIKGKTYGPYYYESYREGGKIKKRYVKMLPKEVTRRVKKPRIKEISVFIVIIVALLVLTLWRYSSPIPSSFFGEELPSLMLAPTGASSGNSSNANLTIWDDSDLGENRYSNVQVNFYANYTDNIGNAIDNNGGNCNIRYDFGEGYTSLENMNYDPALFLWAANSIFNYKGEHIFEIDCRSNLGNIILPNSFVISNSKPDIFKTPGGYINMDGNKYNTDYLRCIEDILCIYDFSANVSDPDINDILRYDFIAGSNSTLTNFILSSETGLIEINITNNNNAGEKKLELTVVDNENARDTGILLVNITPVNDPPVFLNLEDKIFNMSSLFEYVVIADDEEGNLPLGFNMAFLNCTTAQWSYRNSTDCLLFNYTQYSVNESAINISFTPVKNDVGNYTISFSVWDLNNNLEPYNATRSVIVNFTVLNINAPPYFEHVCDNERNVIEDNEFKCYVNATDEDEVNKLVFSSNVSWFLNLSSVSVNSTTDFKGAVLVNFTPSDTNVGNWSVNLSVRDTGSPIGINSTVFWFFVENVNDKPRLSNIEVKPVYYTSESYYKIYVNASDDDLLINDKSIYNEKLSFSSNLSCVRVISENFIIGTNITSAVIGFNPNDACFMGGGSYKVNITVNDSVGVIDSDVFAINVEENIAPIWDANTARVHALIEDIRFYLNLSQNVSDPDGDVITFYFVNNVSFLSFNLNRSTGVIDFVPIDEDVGRHIVNVSAFDGATHSYFVFEFNVVNVNDLPVIERPLGENEIVFDANSNMEIMEDKNADIFLSIKDDDLRIPNWQKSFYNEVLDLEVEIEGRNQELFVFNGPSFIEPDRMLFIASFVPRKGDVGIYNISINVSDLSNTSDFIRVNLTIFEINHAPVLLNVGNQSSAVNLAFYYDINASDLEEGNDSDGNLTFSIVNLTAGGDFLSINSTNGVIELSFNESHVGKYYLNVTVNDSVGFESSADFWLFVYDEPKINLPKAGAVFNLSENKQANLSFMANHSVGNELNYEFFINDILRRNVSYYGNGSQLSWEFKPSFDDETYGLFGNLSLFVYVPVFKHLNATMTWNTNITHTSSPMRLIKDIGEKERVFGKEIIIDLRENFYDADAFDSHYNESARFVVKSNSSVSGISYSVNGWELKLTASSALVEFLNVTGSDLDNNGNAITNATSNYFKVKFIEPVVVEVQVPMPTSGGGGGSSQEKPVSLKIIMPGPVSVKSGEVIILPIEIVNDGFTELKDIKLSGLLAKDGEILSKARMNFSKEHIQSLKVGQRENVSLTIEVNRGELGLFELTINATVENPKYKDWAKIFINYQEGETIVERLVFTEEFIAENPECIELKELLDKTREFIAAGDFNSAEKKLNEAITACKEAISKQSLFSKSRIRAKFEDKIFLYLLITTIIAIIGGISYYSYQIIKFRKIEEAAAKELGGGGK